jgi:hypothetical protein
MAAPSLAPPPMDSSLPIALIRWLQQLWTRTARVQMTESGPYITQGEGAPSADLPVGSLYLRTNGGAGTSLYVKEAAGGGGWVAK